MTVNAHWPDTKDTFERAIVKVCRKAVFDLALADMDKAIQGGVKLGTFILGVCLIDCLSCMYSGSKSNGNTYKEFISIFFSKNYAPAHMYGLIRSHLVHNYTSRKYVYTDGKQNLHLKDTEDGRIYLNLEDFCEDVRSAAYKYFELVDSDLEARSRLIRYYQENGILYERPHP